jgi:hypothetical protein
MVLKLQETVETTIYGLELVAAWIDTDIAMEFRCSIRMMGFVLELEFVEIGMFGIGMFGMGICGVGNFGETLKLEILVEI